MTWLSIGRYTCISDTRSVGGSRSKPVLYYFRFLWSHPESNRLLPFIYTQRQSRNPFTQYQHIKLHSTWHLFFLILWRPPSLSELTLMLFYTGLTHLGSEASIFHVIFCSKYSINAIPIIMWFMSGLVFLTPGWL